MLKPVNPFADKAFKEQLLKKESKDEYEVLEPDNELQEIITGAPKIPAGGALKNVILDASALAKNEKSQRALEITN